MKTTITIDIELAKQLNQLKYLYGYKTIEEVIQRMYDNKLKKEVSKNVKENN